MQFFLRHDVNAAAESATPTSQWRSSKYGSILLSLRDMTMRRKTDGQQINDGQTPSHRIAYLAVDGPAMITLQHNLIIGRFNHCIIIPLSLRRTTTCTDYTDDRSREDIIIITYRYLIKNGCDLKLIKSGHKNKVHSPLQQLRRRASDAGCEVQ